jgi:hypothetical protein
MPKTDPRMSQTARIASGTAAAADGRARSRLLLAALLVAGCGGAASPGRHDAAVMPPDLAFVSTPSLPIAQHRPTADACPSGPGSCTIAGSSCASDSDCTQSAHGHCDSNGTTSCGCRYDQCVSDGECGASNSCVCASQIVSGQLGNPGNVCSKVGNCHVDSDCGAGGSCSPSPTVNGCLPWVGTVEGYFCHAAADSCNNDVDCASGGGKCGFLPELGHWGCFLVTCAG